ncbi:Methylthioribose-1-phosphate isomerase [Planctomycetes bacterium Poly30]|uniref:Methylthioribose-1-phosphate isomerase n=1 Tax=Saltatorellus ferox TaxID=2528018 RepID=A0A518ETI9_9BACT|nr:Methylthioribose-1-phosphate isomerase [Planctomycetes bacterium Poly30]
MSGSESSAGPSAPIDVELPFETLSWVGGLDGHVTMLEQTFLPLREEQLLVRTVPEMVDAIYRLAVRGAPAIGVAAGFGMVLGIAGSDRDVLEVARETKKTLDASRPTAVNLMWATAKVLSKLESLAGSSSQEELRAAAFAEAMAIYEGDRQTCRTMGLLGAELIQDGATLLTHCNAGALATAGIGTALAPIYTAHAQGKRVHVFSDETRPLLQGARITTWELMRAGIDVTLITDSMAARVMSEGKIDAVFVGSDRITRNGDVCNKIGTFGVALAAKHHGIPFHVVAPLSTVDPYLDSGKLIPIEERPASEITEGFGNRTAPMDAKVYAPAFDVTPAELVTSIITEAGIIESPSMTGIEAALDRGGVQWRKG